MKLYTIQEVINAYFNGLRDGRSNFSDLDICLNSLTPIELPSDEDIDKQSEIFNHVANRDIFFGGAKWVINNIKQQDK